MSQCRSQYHSWPPTKKRGLGQSLRLIKHIWWSFDIDFSHKWENFDWRSDLTITYLETYGNFSFVRHSLTQLYQNHLKIVNNYWFAEKVRRRWDFWIIEFGVSKQQTVFPMFLHGAEEEDRSIIRWFIDEEVGKRAQEREIKTSTLLLVKGFPSSQVEPINSSDKLEG